MYKDIAINWDVFQYKFTEKTRDVFEYLAYILFVMSLKSKQEYLDTLISHMWKLYL